MEEIINVKLSFHYKYIELRTLSNVLYNMKAKEFL